MTPTQLREKAKRILDSPRFIMNSRDEHDGENIGVTLITEILVEAHNEAIELVIQRTPKDPYPEASKEGNTWIEKFHSEIRSLKIGEEK